MSKALHRMAGWCSFLTGAAVAASLGLLAAGVAAALLPPEPASGILATANYFVPAGCCALAGVMLSLVTAGLQRWLRSFTYLVRCCSFFPHTAALGLQGCLAKQIYFLYAGL